ncbi:MAG: hypothetical protein QOG85_2122, partial [Gaiellaceae bacterium]|nr:hypothetical protein [Gaiellaceae bacterium]
MVGPVGRDAERRSVATFLAAAASGPAILAIAGEPGIGKSTMCRYAVELAEAAGSTVLVCRPTEAESMMSFAGLTDLMSGIADDALAALPAPQHHALAVASLREEPSDATLDERAVGTGLATLLSQLATRGPVVVVVDDAQWLDAASLDVLQFAFRRTTDQRVGLLVSRRVGPDVGIGLATAMAEPAWRQEMTLGGLTMASLFHIVRDQANLMLARPALVRVVDLSGGNPFLAIELARRGGSNLSSLVVDRLSPLSDRAREALLAVACSPRPTPALIERLGLHGHLDDAETAGIVEVVEGRVRFTHPLLASASIDAAAAPAVRAMHARLAAMASDAETVARHLALATSGPDDAVAAALDIAAERAAKRGASIAAVELARLAMLRTEDPDGLASWTRRVRVAELLYTAGDTAEAAGLLDRLAEACPSGSVRGRGWLTLLQVAYQTSSLAEARACGRAALSDAADDDSLRTTALLSLAVVSEDIEERIRLTGEA